MTCQFIQGSDLVESQMWCKGIWSGRRDSNPQPSAWEADALPLRHTRSGEVMKIIKVLPGCQRVSD